MAHSKVYGICESKCKVEVLPKKDTYGISKELILAGNAPTIYDVETNTRYVQQAGDTTNVGIHLPTDFTGYFEVVISRRILFNKPSDYLTIYGADVKFINNSFDDSNSDKYVMYKFYDNSLHIVCECLSYAE